MRLCYSIKENKNTKAFLNFEGKKKQKLQYIENKSSIYLKPNVVMTKQSKKTMVEAIPKAAIKALKFN